MEQKQNHLRKLTLTAMMAAIAFLSLYVIKIPMFDFLTYDVKDVPITLCAFVYGPLTGFCVSLLTAVLEMVTISNTGPIGLLMNVLSSIAFSCTASWIYAKKRTLHGAILGLLSGIAAMTATMLLWNYLITPFYQGVPRAAVAAMLPTVFLPFNLIKATMNAALVYLLYKPFTRILRMTHFLPPEQTKRRHAWLPTMCAAAVLIASVVMIVVLS